MTERKRLKAVRRRNTKVSNHNFEVKTLKQVPIATDGMNRKDIKAIEEQMTVNKQRRIERGR